MSLAQTIDALPNLTPEVRRQLHLHLQALEEEPQIEATPEMVAAIEEAIRASGQGRVFTLEDVRVQAESWTAK